MKLIGGHGRNKVPTGWSGPRRGPVALGFVCAIVLLAAPSARAATVYTPVGSFGSSGTEAGQFESPQRVAVDPLTGDIFVADTGGDRVEVFRPAAAAGACAEACATYLTQFGSSALTDEPFGVAVDPATGDVYVMAAGTTEAIVKFAPDDRADPTSYGEVPDAEFTSPSHGTGAAEVGSFGEVTVFGVGVGAIAVDPTGAHDLLLADPGNHVIDRFTPEGAFLGAFDGAETTSGEPSGEPGALLAKPVDLAVGPAGDVYVADLQESPEALRFLRFAGDGTYQATLADPPESNPTLSAAVLGVDPVAGDTFLSSFSFFSPSQVYRYGADDQQIEHFRCPGQRCESPLLGIAAAAPAGALAGRLYVVAANSFSGGSPSVEVFETVELPRVTIEAPSAITTGAATFHGTVDPAGSDAHWRFEYRPAGTGPWSDLPVPDGDAGAGSGPVAVEATASGLASNTGYEVRLEASKGESTVTSATLTFSTGAAPVDVVTGEVFSATDTSITLGGTIDPHNSPVVDCHFEYGTTGAYGQSAPCSQTGAEIDDRDEVQQVTVPATGRGTFVIGFEGASTAVLPVGEPATAIEVALDELATIGGVGGSVAVGGGPQGATPRPYVVTFGGSLAGRDVRQLVLAKGGGQAFEEIHPDERAVETTHPGGSPVLVSADVAGLDPGTTFHFRLVADDGVGGTQEGADAGFTTRTTEEVGHPERHYELVSAADTNSAAAEAVAAGADGDAYAWGNALPTPPDPLSGKQSLYVATRNPDGSWSQRPADLPAPPRSGVKDVPVAPSELFDDGLSRVTYEGFDFDPDDQNRYPDTYLKQIATGQVTWLSHDPSIAGPQTEGGRATPFYISPDGATVVLGAERALLPADAAAPRQALYQWHEGALSLISQVPASGSSCGGGGPACVGATDGSALGSLLGPETGTSYGAVAGDGSRVVFEVDPNEPRLYVRLGGERTVAADAPAPGAPPLSGSPLEVEFRGADAEDEHIFFTSSSPLTPDSTAPDAVREAPPLGLIHEFEYGVYGGLHDDLYDYDVDSGSTRDLTPSSGGAGVERVYDVSSDGRRLYFTDQKRLNAAGELTETAAPEETLQGTPGGPNLYLAELVGSQVRLKFIATIDPFEDTTAAQSVRGPQAARQLAASPDGSLFVFRDSLNAVPGRRTGGFPQAFVYDAVREELSCASCPGDASAAAGPAKVAIRDQINNLSGPTLRSASDRGSVFLETPTALVGADGDGVGDVYEWRGGKPVLISAGTGGRSSELAGASTDGSTVFFASSDGLVPGAQPGGVHIYAARVGAGAQAQAPAPPCSGEDCRGPGPGAAASPGIGTSTFGGPGNGRPLPRCPKGRRRQGRHGVVRCVARHRHRRHRHRQGHGHGRTAK